MPLARLCAIGNKSGRQIALLGISLAVPSLEKVWTARVFYHAIVPEPSDEIMRGLYIFSLLAGVSLISL